MTIKNKILVTGVVIFLMFAVIALMNIRIHRELSASLDTRGQMIEERAGLREFVLWKNTLVQSISDIMISGHVPASVGEHFQHPAGTSTPEYTALETAGRKLVQLIAEKESAMVEMNRTFEKIKTEVNDIHDRLNQEITTMQSTPEEETLALSALIALDQLTLVAMDSLISGKIPKKDETTATKTRQFVSTRLDAMDPEGGISPLFAEMFAGIERLRNSIIKKNETLPRLERLISAAKDDFDLAVQETDLWNTFRELQAALDDTNNSLEHASRRSLETTLFFMFIVPLIVIVAGIVGLNRIIVRPITRLMASMRHVKDGNFDVKAPVGPRDEIGRMAKAFNAMAGEINARVVEMERLNRTLLENESSLQLYQFIFDTAAVGIYMMDETGKILDVNPRGCRFLGYTREELRTMNVMELAPSESGRRWEALWQRLNESGMDHYEAFYCQKDHGLFPAEIFTNLLEYQGQRFCIAFAQDMTQKKQAEKALRENQILLSNILESIDDGIVMLDTEFRYRVYNKSAERMFGKPRGEVLGRHPWEAFPETTKSDIPEHIRAAMGGRESGSVQRQITIPPLMDGWFRDNFSPIRDDRGQIRGVVGVVSDITRHKRDEEELRRLRNYLSNIIDSMPSQIIGVDSNGRITQWNRAIWEETGISSGDAQGKSLSEILPWMASELAKISESITSRKSLQEQRIPRERKGGIAYEDITIFPLIANGVEGAVIRVDDVTDRVRMEEMMIQSEKMLSVGGLAAGMAHEINNPLAGMMQTAEVLGGRLGGDLRMPANQRAAEAAGISLEDLGRFMEARGIPRMLEAISESGVRVAAIVNNMLSFARKTDASVSAHRLEELINATLELAATDYDLKREYDFKQIEIQREYAGDLPQVPCEAGKIQQVLLNILRNGAQAMQEAKTESPRFVFRTRFETERDMAVVEIEDNGPGMDEETRKRIFEPFFTTKPAGIGTGLGLSVSYFIITENHGGEMMVIASPGAGAKFTIRLPAHGKKEPI